MLNVQSMPRFLITLAAIFVTVSCAWADPATASVQKKLKGMGYYSGEVDGTYGSRTAAAIRRYQIAKNLQVTGRLNPQTRKSLGLSTAD